MMMNDRNQKPRMRGLTQRQRRIVYWMLIGTLLAAVGIVVVVVRLYYWVNDAKIEFDAGIPDHALAPFHRSRSLFTFRTDKFSECWAQCMERIECKAFEYSEVAHICVGAGGEINTVPVKGYTVYRRKTMR